MSAKMTYIKPRPYLTGVGRFPITRDDPCSDVRNELMAMGYTGDDSTRVWLDKLGKLTDPHFIVCDDIMNDLEDPKPAEWGTW